MQVGVFFDLDGTLCTVHIWQAMVRHHRLKRINLPLLWLYIGTHYPLYIFYRLRILSRVQAYLKWAQDMSWLLRGMTVAQGQEAFAWIADQEVLPSVRPDIMALLRQHQDAGHRVILVSGTFQPLLEIIAARLGVREALGTLLEVRDGRYTGRSLPPVCLGPGKLARLRQFLDGPGADIDLARSFAYADGEWDIPVLELVGNPVAVYPEPSLLAQARQRGWQVIPQAED